MKLIAVVLVTFVLYGYSKVKAQGDDYLYLIDETLVEAEVTALTNKFIKFKYPSNRGKVLFAEQVIDGF